MRFLVAPTVNITKASALHAASCQVLYEMRNGIYKERGSCFKTPKAIQAFGNAGCLYDDVNEVPLNQYERANVETLLAAEKKRAASSSPYPPRKRRTISLKLSASSRCGMWPMPSRISAWPSGMALAISRASSAFCPICSRKASGA
jgi:hypothetical protein